MILSFHSSSPNARSDINVCYLLVSSSVGSWDVLRVREGCPGSCAGAALALPARMSDTGFGTDRPCTLHSLSYTRLQNQREG